MREYFAQVLKISVGIHSRVVVIAALYTFTLRICAGHSGTSSFQLSHLSTTTNIAADSFVWWFYSGVQLSKTAAPLPILKGKGEKI